MVSGGLDGSYVYEEDKTLNLGRNLIPKFLPQIGKVVRLYFERIIVSGGQI